MPFFAKRFGLRAGRQPLSNFVGAESNADGSKAIPDDALFVGTKPVAGGSWVMCQDHKGRPFWWNGKTGQWTYEIYTAAAAYVPPPQKKPPINVKNSATSAKPSAAGGPSSSHADAQQLWLIPGDGLGPVFVSVDPTATTVVAPAVVSPQRHESEGMMGAGGYSSTAPWVWETLYDKDGREVWIHAAFPGQTAIKDRHITW